MPSSTFVSEPLTPLNASFDTHHMAQGEPGMPHQFRWRKQEWEVAEVLETWREHGDCTHGSGERYVRKHGYRIRTTTGLVLKIYFQRKYGKTQRKEVSRWWVFSIESES